MRQLSEEEEKWISAIDKAKEDMRKSSDGEEIIRLISMVYFRQTHTITGAALEQHISKPTAQRRVGRFISAVAKHKGLLRKDGEQ